MSLNIVVLVKQVPDTESERKLVPGAGTLRPHLFLARDGPEQRPVL